MAALIGMSGEFKGKTFLLDRDVVTIGRSKDNVIILEHPTVSGHHCNITREENRFILHDLESTNGTRLNSKEITDGKLRPKDLVQVGSVEFMYDAEKTDAEETQSYAETQVEVARGPVAAPDSFESISPFGARHAETRGFWFVILSIVGVLALIGVVWFFFKLLTT